MLDRRLGTRAIQVPDLRGAAIPLARRVINPLPSGPGGGVAFAIAFLIADSCRDPAADVIRCAT
jgi:hypothetical protein